MAVLLTPPPMHKSWNGLDHFPCSGGHQEAGGTRRLAWIFQRLSCRVFGKHTTDSSAKNALTSLSSHLS